MPLPPAPLVTESEEDAARVASALRGDPGAHRALYERYRPLAWRVAITMRLERFRARVKGRVLAGMARLRGKGS